MSVGLRSCNPGKTNVNEKETVVPLLPFPQNSPDAEKYKKFDTLKIVAKIIKKYDFT